MDLDPVILSRLQFAWVIGWHILLPAFTVAGLLYCLPGGLLLLRPARKSICGSRFWTRIFAVSFGMGVVSGIDHAVPVRHQLEPLLRRRPPNVISPLLAYEGITAFFLEAAFLGVLLFGRKLVPPGRISSPPYGGARHSVLVVLDPRRQQLDADAGRLRDHRWPLLSRDWLDIIFNPSFPYRLAHTVVRLLRHDRLCRARRRRLSDPRGASLGGARMLSMTLWLLDRPRAAPDLARRSARPEHAATPASQARRHRGALDTGAQRSAHAFRASRRSERNQPLRHRLPYWEA